MKLTQRDKEIALASQFCANAPTSELKKATGYPEHQIHYSLRRLLDEGILRPWALLNFSALGFEEYRVFFSLAAEKRQAQDKLLAAIKSDGRVVWVGELGGSYQYAMTIYCRSGLELAAFLESLVQRCGNIFLKKAVLLDLSFNLFKKKYLAPKKTNNEYISVTQVTQKVDLDETDYKILSVLSQPLATSHREMSRICQIPRATIDLRLKKLEEKGVILRYVHFISALKLGMHVYRLLIFARGIQKGLHDKIMALCAKHPNVVNLTHCIGPWDYEATVEVEDVSEISAVMEAFYTNLAGLINDIEVLSLFSQHSSFNLQISPEKKNVRK